jgi:hypothetical protein
MPHCAPPHGTPRNSPPRPAWRHGAPLRSSERSPGGSEASCGCMNHSPSRPQHDGSMLLSTRPAARPICRGFSAPPRPRYRRQWASYGSWARPRGSSRRCCSAWGWPDGGARVGDGWRERLQTTERRGCPFGTRRALLLLLFSELFLCSSK